MPHDEWLIEKEFLKNFYPTAIIVRDKLPGYTVRKDNTISYHGNFYRVPYGTYNGNGTTVLLSVKEEALFLYDHQNNLIAEHLLSKEKGKIIGGTSYRRDRSLELVVLKQNTLLLRPNCNILATYIEEIHKDKPRYLRDNLKVIREVIGEYSEDLVYKALDYCLEHSLYNAFNLKETAEYYRKLTSMHKEPQVAVNPLRDGVQMRQFNTSAYIPERTSINQYDKILEEI